MNWTDPVHQRQDRCHEGQPEIRLVDPFRAAVATGLAHGGAPVPTANTKGPVRNFTVPKAGPPPVIIVRPCARAAQRARPRHPSGWARPRFPRDIPSWQGTFRMLGRGSISRTWWITVTALVRMFAPMPPRVGVDDANSVIGDSFLQGETLAARTLWSNGQ